MQLATLLDHASSIMTLLSFITFIGILAWTFVLRRADDFAEAAALPFADEDGEQRHV